MMIRYKKIFITGGAGFIATSLIRRLIKDNHIVVYDSLHRNSLKDSRLWNHPHLSVVKGDILSYQELRAAIPGDVDMVIHMAAIAGIDTVIKNSVRTMEVNMVGVYHVLKALHERGLLQKVKRFVNFSTSEVFGINSFKTQESQATNLQPVGEARWTYAVSKLAAEHMVHSYYKEYQLPAVTVRPFNIYGPGQVGEGAIHHFVIRAIKNKPLMIHGDGDQIRSWCYIDDMVEGLCRVLVNPKAIGQVFNIGNPRGTLTILGLAEKIVQLAHSSSAIMHVPRNYVDVELRIPNIDKAQKLLQFAPTVDLNEGISKTVLWYRRHYSRSR
jgi:UDP-glucuronate decarboxylase